MPLFFYARSRQKNAKFKIDIFLTDPLFSFFRQKFTKFKIDVFQKNRKFKIDVFLFIERLFGNFFIERLFGFFLIDF